MGKIWNYIKKGLTAFYYSYIWVYLLMAIIGVVVGLIWKRVDVGFFTGAGLFLSTILYVWIKTAVVWLKTKWKK